MEGENNRKRSGEIEIIPAIMPQSIEDIREKVQSIRQQVKTFQLDIMDGNYVPAMTIPFRHGGKLDEKVLQEIRDEGLPYWQEVNYELDLMVQKAEQFFDTFLAFSPSRIIFHLASISDWELVYSLLRDYQSIIEFGIAVTVFDDLKFFDSIMERGNFSFIQCMGIERIGYMGQEFSDRVFSLMRYMKKNYPELIISIDGGVSEETAPLLVEEGARRLVSGSYIYKHGIPAEQVEELKFISNGYESD